MKARTNTNTNTNTNGSDKPNFTTVSGFKVMRTHQFDDGSVAFDLSINGILINGCSVRANKEGEAFISWPSRQNPRDQKWYRVASAYLSQEDQDKIISEVYKVVDSE